MYYSIIRQFPLENIDKKVINRGFHHALGPSSLDLMIMRRAGVSCSFFLFERKVIELPN